MRISARHGALDRLVKSGCDGAGLVGRGLRSGGLRHLDPAVSDNFPNAIDHLFACFGEQAAHVHLRLRRVGNHVVPGTRANRSGRDAGAKDGVELGVMGPDFPGRRLQGGRILKPGKHRDQPRIFGELGKLAKKTPHRRSHARRLFGFRQFHHRPGQVDDRIIVPRLGASPGRAPGR